VQDGAVEIKEWTSYVKACFRKRSIIKGEKFLLTLFNKFTRHYVKFLQEEVERTRQEGDAALLEQYQLKLEEEMGELAEATERSGDDAWELLMEEGMELFSRLCRMCTD